MQSRQSFAEGAMTFDTAFGVAVLGIFFFGVVASSFVVVAVADLGAFDIRPAPG